MRVTPRAYTHMPPCQRPVRPRTCLQSSTRSQPYFMAACVCILPADSGFKCTYCGAAVAMTQQQRIQQAQQQQQEQQQGGGSGSGQPDAAAAAADAQAQAVAFKDRLVEYDRHAQQRTTVIDDQSDFFEIETNAWLSEEVRGQ